MKYITQQELDSLSFEQLGCIIRSHIQKIMGFNGKGLI